MQYASDLQPTNSIAFLRDAEPPAPCTRRSFLLRPAPPLFSRMQNTLAQLQDPTSLSIAVHWRTFVSGLRACIPHHLAPSPIMCFNVLNVCSLGRCGVCPRFVADDPSLESQFSCMNASQDKSGVCAPRTGNQKSQEGIEAVYRALFSCVKAVERRWKPGFRKVRFIA